MKARVLGRGEKSPLSDAESELRLGREKEKEKVRRYERVEKKKNEMLRGSVTQGLSKFSGMK